MTIPYNEYLDVSIVKGSVFLALSLSMNLELYYVAAETNL